MVQRKVAEVVDRSGLSPRSHSGKDLMAILENYPRDELFQIRTDDLYRTVMGVLRLAGPPPGAAVPAPGPVRPVHLLPGLPAPGPVHHGEPAAHPGDPAARAERRRGRLHHPGHRVDAGPDALHRPDRPDRRRPARSTPTRSPTQLADGDPLLGRRLPAACWSASSATSRPRHLLEPVRRRAAGGATRTSTRRTRRCRTWPSWSCSRSPASSCMHLSTGGARATTARRAVQGLPVRRADDALRRAAGAALARRPGRRRAAVRGAPGRRHRSTSTTSACALPAGARETRRGPAARGERVRGRLARRGRDGRVQRAGAAGRADLAAGGGAARVRQVSAPGRHRLLPGVHGGRRSSRTREIAGAAGGALRDPVRRRRCRHRGRAREQRDGELVDAIRAPARRGGQPRPGPDPARRT